MIEQEPTPAPTAYHQQIRSHSAPKYYRKKRDEVVATDESDQMLDEEQSPYDRAASPKMLLVERSIDEILDAQAAVASETIQQCQRLFCRCADIKNLRDAPWKKKDRSEKAISDERRVSALLISLANKLNDVLRIPNPSEKIPLEVIALSVRALLVKMLEKQQKEKQKQGWVEATTEHQTREQPVTIRA